MKSTIRMVVAVVMGLAGAGAAWGAESADKVGPEVYKRILDNNRVTVLEGHFAPGAKVGMHTHPDHVAYIVSNEPAKLRLTYPDGTTKEIDGKPGEPFWIPAETHASENIGTTDVKILVVELKEPPTHKP